MPRHYPKRKQLLCQEQFEAQTVAQMCLLAGLHISKRGMFHSTSAAAARLRRTRRRNFLLLAAVCLEAGELPQHRASNAAYRHLPPPGLGDFDEFDCISHFRFRKRDLIQLMASFRLLNEHGQPHAGPDGLGRRSS